MERINQALRQARTGSKLHKMLDEFFLEQTAQTIEAMKTCARPELLDNRAYLLAIWRLEQELLEHIDKYNLIEARRQHVGS